VGKQKYLKKDFYIFIEKYFMTKVAPIILVAIASVLWGFIGFFVRNISKISGNEILLFRFLIGLILLSFFMIITGKRFSKFNSKWLLINSVAYSVWVIFYINSIASGTPLANAAFLLYTSTIFSILFSRIILKEFVSKRKLFFILLAFLGVIFILKPINMQIHYGEFLSLMAGIIYGFQIVTTRKLMKNFDVYSVMFYSFLIAFIITVPLNISNFVIPDFKSTIYLILLSVLSTTIPAILFTYSLKKLKAFEASTVALLEPLTASLVGFLIFSEFLDIFSIVGGFMILISCFEISKASRKIR
jgi:DME family drug/metabolite transporter